MWQEHESGRYDPKSPEQSVRCRSPGFQRERAASEAKRSVCNAVTFLSPETQEIVPPSKFSVIKSKIQAPFTRVFWEDALEQTDGETLVDSKLLSYAYLEAGVIEMAGA